MTIDFEAKESIGGNGGAVGGCCEREEEHAGYAVSRLLRYFTQCSSGIGLISDMESQLSEGGMGAAELAKAKKRLEQELEEVRTSMEVRVRTKRHNILSLSVKFHV